MKRKIRKLLIVLSVFIFCLTLYFNVIAIAKTSDKEGIIELSSNIVAVSPGDGEDISLVNKYIETLFEKYDGDLDEVNGLHYHYSEMDTFVSVLSDSDAVRALYNKWDDYNPINNIIEWEYDGEGVEYDFILSRNADLSTKVYSCNVTESKVVLDNILYPNEKYYWQVKAYDSKGEVTYSNIFSFTTKDTIRTINIDGVSNVRDIGGLNTPYGRTVNGLVYRSGRLDDITEKGVSQMDALGIKSDIDLRQLNEGRENPSNRENNYKYLDCPSYGSIFVGETVNNFKEIISLFANPNNYPLLFHCSIGRDRTGTLSSLLNILLGVDRNTVISEYMTSFFSVTGSVGLRGQEANLVEAIEGLYLNLDNFEGETYAIKAENYLKSIGVTQDEIDSIRDILTGKISVLPSDEANDGYQDKCFVFFKAYGRESKAYIVDKGSLIKEPYQLDNNYVWMENGSKADFSKPINSNKTFVGSVKEAYTIIVYLDGVRSEEFYEKGTTIDLSKYSRDGYNYFVINESGDILSSLSVNKNMVINVIYIKQ